MKKIFLSMAVLATLAFTSCKDNENKEADEAMTEEQMAMEAEATTEEEMPEQQTIATIAMGNENFTTLVTAIQAAELGETLNGAGPFTVFAPTNAAFDKLPAGTLEGLTKPENKEKLAGLLKYHVVSGEYMAADVVKAINDNNGSFVIKTVQGGELTATLDGENVIITDANGNKSKVVMADVDASNGVIHAIDAVVMPKM
ncbi:MAG: fasciclin domain-containing protein [Leeuwenhoekiella sp.]|uniref:fasciclin domain-containing protein n=1 Tax=Leeuwenhoekiella sp. MAR_2009_132 TaxID=1392489 RepID=UPI00048F5285|nr:fasciclin domain-containing protein [Leeuwenhoekiella sp. MAR_2009_132]MDP5045232.1 fasciclin domain-containing protein [Leeuwenhoekiella sp.]